MINELEKGNLNTKYTGRNLHTCTTLNSKHAELKPQFCTDLTYSFVVNELKSNLLVIQMSFCVTMMN